MDNIIQSFKTIKEVEEYRNKINEECNSRIEFINIVKKADDLSNKSFGYIKECFESISPELFNTKEGKSILNKYTSVVKRNKNLSTLHNIFEGIRKSGKNTDFNFLIEQIMNKNENHIDKSTLKKDVKSLGMVLAEGYALLGKEADDLLPKENVALYSAIDYITENKSTLKNIAEYSDAVSIIRENIENKDIKNVFESRNLEDLASELLEEFNKKYSDNLTEEEASVLKEIASSNDRETVFNKYKNSCVEKISEAKKNFDSKGDTNSSKRLENVIEQVSNKKFCLDTIGEDICNLMELSNIFE